MAEHADGSPLSAQAAPIPKPAVAMTAATAPVIRVLFILRLIVTP